jgi:hypothetical protein
MSTARALYAKEELRAITRNDGHFDNAVMISSVIPPAKSSCFGSSLMFTKGRTAIDGRSGTASSKPGSGDLE